MAKKTLYKTRIFEITEEYINGNQVILLDSPNWVNIIPINDKNEILFIKQYRYGTQEITLEIPGGLIDEKDSSPLEAAKRELLEETGYSSDSWVEHGKVLANPAYQNNSCHFFTARNIKKTADLNLDHDEHITESFFVPESEVVEMIKRGEIEHSIILANLASYFLKKNS